MTINKSNSYKALKWTNHDQAPVQDWIVQEEPLQININGKPYTVTMRTPGNDLFLVKGLLFTENIYSDPGELAIKVLEEESIISVWIEPSHLRSGYYNSRSLLSVSSCGICGKRELNDLCTDNKPLEKGSYWESSMIESLFVCMNDHQASFHQTGGAHAAACFSYDGTLLSIQEDIGRHNAVDKVIGELIDKNLMRLAGGLVVSGRVSYEIVCKCYKAGVPLLAAVSSPSTMAIETAEALGLTLLGFCREDSFTCYSHPDRLIFSKSKILQP